MNILIVEDDPVNQLVLKFYFEDKCRKLVLVENGKEGLDVFNRMPDLDIIITDIMMQGVDGISMAREIRQGSKKSDIPIIAITAGGFRKSEIPNSPFDQLLSKPINLADLQKEVGAFVKQGAFK